MPSWWRDAIIALDPRDRAILLRLLGYQDDGAGLLVALLLSQRREREGRC